jgi:23S rRNA pseudouridine1911/1915/1917 synthase
MRRVLEVPESLSGERADAGIAKLLGLSRSLAAELLTNGGVEVKG